MKRRLSRLRKAQVKRRFMSVYESEQANGKSHEEAFDSAQKTVETEYQDFRGIGVFLQFLLPLLLQLLDIDVPELNDSEETSSDSSEETTQQADE